MEFLEGSRGIYRPIRVLFDTPIYDRALQLCWHINSYKSQIALVVELLKLQQQNQIPSQVTAEDMINLILEKSKNTLRENLWEFELEGFDEVEAKPLLMLVWAMNVSNKMRDVEFEAKMLLESPETVPPNFQHPKVRCMARDYAKILTQRQQEPPSSKVLSPKEVVMEVVPRVLQGFWVLPSRVLLNMPSQKLSRLSVGVTKATLDRVSSALTTVGHQATFSRSIRDDMVLSILTEIRQTHPLDILVNRIKNFAPVLLSEIADVATRQICELFQPQSPKVPSLLTPVVEPPATTSAAVKTLPAHPAVPASNTKVQARDAGSSGSSQVKNPKSSETTNTVTNTVTVTVPLTPSAEPASKIQTREDFTEEHNLEKSPKLSAEPDTAAVKTLSHPAVPASISKVQAKEAGSSGPSQVKNPKSSKKEDFAVIKVTLTPPAEPASKIQTREDFTEEHSLETSPKLSTEPETAVVKTLSHPAVPASISKAQAKEAGSGGPILEEDATPSTEPDRCFLNSDIQKLNMEFLEGSRGIYRPIRVLFDTPIYDRALQLCWHINSYKSQIALVVELLKLQQQNQIPSQVTAEDMINLILEKSKNTLRENLWEFELEGFDEVEAKPLLMLVWAMNVSNKMRDVEFEAKMLLESPETVPPNFQHPKVRCMARDYAKILTQRQQEPPSSKVLSPKEVVMEVVPRVLQGFWVLPSRVLLNMPSQKLSRLSVGVTKATLDRVSSALTTVGHQATFSRSIGDDMVLSILTEIRQTHPLDILVNRIKNFAPVLLSEIADVATRQICELFQPQSPKVPSLLTPVVEPPATTSAAVKTLPAHPAVTASNTKVQARDAGSSGSSQVKNPKSSETTNTVTNTVTVTVPLTPSAEPASKIQTREDFTEEHNLEKSPKLSAEPDTAAVKTLSHPAVPASISKVQAKEAGSSGPSQVKNPKSSKKEDFAVIKVTLTPPAEPASKIQTREDFTEEHSLETSPKLSTEPETAVVKTLSHPAVPASISKAQAKEAGSGGPILEEDATPSTEPDRCFLNSDIQKLNMEFLEGSRGIYRPIRVLFDTPIYDRALQLCWHINSYKSQIALVVELLKLQQQNQIPSQVTAEDMINLILEKSKNTLRENLWEFELEGFDEVEAKPLLMLVWAMNVSNKMRDVEFEAKMLLESPETVPPNFQHPKVRCMARDYAKILTQRQQEPPSSKVLSPKEVVMEVVPRVLQGFWVLPSRVLLNMPSQKLSRLSVGVTKATLDRVSSALTTVGHQATFSRSIRDDMVLSILTEIRQTHPLDILVNRIKNFAPVLLSEIADVATRQICELFQPQSPKVPSLLTPVVEPPATTSAAVKTLPAHPAVPASNTKVQARDAGSSGSSQVKNPKSSETTNTVTNTVTVTVPLIPSAEPASKIQTREDFTEEHNLEKSPKLSAEPDTAAVKTLSHPAVPASISKVQAKETGSSGPSQVKDPKSSEIAASAAIKVTSTPPAEPASMVQTREDFTKEHSLEKSPKLSTEPEAVVKTLSHPAVPASISKVQASEASSSGPSQVKNPKSSETTNTVTVTVPLTPSAEPASKIQTREEEHSLEKSPKLSTELDTAAGGGLEEDPKLSTELDTAAGGGLEEDPSPSIEPDTAAGGGLEEDPNPYIEPDTAAGGGLEEDPSPSIEPDTAAGGGLEEDPSPSIEPDTAAGGGLEEDPSPSIEPDTAAGGGLEEDPSPSIEPDTAAGGGLEEDPSPSIEPDTAAGGGLEEDPSPSIEPDTAAGGGLEEDPNPSIEPDTAAGGGLEEDPSPSIEPDPAAGGGLEEDPKPSIEPDTAAGVLEEDPSPSIEPDPAAGGGLEEDPSPYIEPDPAVGGGLEEDPTLSIEPDPAVGGGLEEDPSPYIEPDPAVGGGLEEDPTLTIEPDTAAVQVLPVPLEPVVVVIDHSEVNMTKRKRVMRFLRRLFQPLCCCCSVPSATETD
ncbi:mucin-16-like [Trachinotus anak]|uniref:mucin-16-like n=1 Tax=Trachinotus anak TaxID=443729 RepID=UPI0039F22D92